MNDVGTSRPGAAAGDVHDLTTVQLIERLSAQISMLVRTEMSHAVDEMKDRGGRFGLGVGISGFGVLLVLYGLATLIATAVLGLATVLDAWLAALIVAVVVLVLGGIVAAVGARNAKQATPPIPQDTAGSVREDVVVVKEHIR